MLHDSGQADYWGPRSRTGTPPPVASGTSAQVVVGDDVRVRCQRTVISGLPAASGLAPDTESAVRPREVAWDSS